jgi:hypothetical protein
MTVPAPKAVLGRPTIEADQTEPPKGMIES